MVRQVVATFVLVFPALSVAGLACESNLNLGEEGDGSAPDARYEDGAQDAAPIDSFEDAPFAPDSSAIDASDSSYEPDGCKAMCERLIDTCSVVPAFTRGECLTSCQGAPPQVFACVARTPCDRILSECGNPEDAATCRQLCNASYGRRCLSASDLSLCRTTCGSASSSARVTYAVCENAAGDCGRSYACYQELVRN